MEDWAEIHRLYRAEGMPIKAIVRKLGVGRNTVRRALARESPPVYSRPAKPTIVDPFEPQIRALLAQWPSMPVPVIADRSTHQSVRESLRNRHPLWRSTGCSRNRQAGLGLTDIDILRVEDGRIVERWGETNGLEMMQQITSA